MDAVVVVADLEVRMPRLLVYLNENSLDTLLLQDVEAAVVASVVVAEVEVVGCLTKDPQSMLCRLAHSAMAVRMTWS